MQLSLRPKVIEIFSRYYPRQFGANLQRFGYFFVIINGIRNAEVFIETKGLTPYKIFVTITLSYLIFVVREVKCTFVQAVRLCTSRTAHWGVEV
jgi:hypothetical protein